jgi:hypothetical protein
MNLDGIEYVRADSVSAKAAEVNGKEYVLVRTYSAGVHVGYLETRNGKEVTLLNARRLWYWDGAASLSQLAVDGVAKGDKCKFPCEVECILLTEAIEVIPCTQKSQDSIKAVPIWKM